MSRPEHASLPFGLMLAVTILCTLSMLLLTLAPFLIFRLSWNYLTALCWFPFYAIWKFFIRLGGRPNEWVRTVRPQPAKQKMSKAARAGSIAAGEEPSHSLEVST